jgi:RimJ/RimL family protein N-acetyltransferase
VPIGSQFRGALRSGTATPRMPDTPRISDPRHPVLATPNARLRALLPDDRDRLVEILAQHSCACATIDEPHDLDVNRARRWIDSRVKEEKIGYALHWAICPLSDDALVGYVGLHDIDLERGHAELCFWVASNVNPDAVMKEAAQTALAFAFETLHMSSMRAVSLPGKVGAAELLSSVGMRRLQPVCEGDSNWTRFSDVHIWTITRNRWELCLLRILHN